MVKFSAFVNCVLFLFALSVIISWCKAPKMATVTLSESNNKQHIEVAVNDTIQIQLDESPTTGYKWEVIELNKNDLQVLSEDYERYPNAGIGGGGIKMIKLKVLKKASGRIRLENRQPWSGDVYKRFEVSYS
jgi:inhibitor of cysteine peptidase